MRYCVQALVVNCNIHASNSRVTFVRNGPASAKQYQQIGRPVKKVRVFRGFVVEVVVDLVVGVVVVDLLTGV